VRDSEIVLGKFLAAWVLVAITLLPTLLYVIVLAFLGPLDIGPAVSGYIGLLLMAAVYVGIGLLASSLTENQIVAFIISFLVILALFLLNKVLIYVPEGLASTFEFLGIDYHFSNIARGVIDSRDLIYFASLIGFSLLLATMSLERRKWQS
jgi:ABC-2 type transport system permease protein